DRKYSVTFFETKSGFEITSAMVNPARPTDEDAERARGRVALWLDVSDLEWLSQRCDCTADTSEIQRDRCARVRFRARAALHKAGFRGRFLFRGKMIRPCRR